METTNRHLVTGGYGFIGSNLANKIGKLWSKDKLDILDPIKKGVSVPQHVRAEHRHIEASTNDAGIYEPGDLELGSYTTIFHLGAESHVCNSHSDPQSFFEANVYGTFRLLDGLRKLPKDRRPRVVMMSTDEVFGDLAKGDEDPDTHFWNHGSRYNPRNPYAATKAAADMLAMAWAETWGLNLTLVHCCNAFGQHQSDEKLIPRVIRAKLAGEPVKLYGDGSQVREWIYVEDVAEGLMQVAIMGRSAGKHVNLSSGMRCANKAIVQIVGEVMQQMRIGQASGIEYTNDRPTDDQVYGLASSPQLDGQWRARTNLGVALKRTIEFIADGKITEQASPLVLPKAQGGR